MTRSPSSLDEAETAVAVKRVSRWPYEDRQFVMELPPAERESVMTLVALLDVRPDGPARAEA